MGARWDRSPASARRKEPFVPHGRPSALPDPASVRPLERVGLADARFTAARGRGAKRRGHERARRDPQRILGRGPRTASTLHDGNVIVTLMHGVLTRAEKSLVRTDRAHFVKSIRQLFQETMEADSRAAVERLTGRNVVAFISGNHIDPDIEADVFILDKPL